MVLGAKTYSSNAPFLAAGFDGRSFDEWMEGTGADRIFDGADDFDLDLLEARTLDGHTQVVTYQPTQQH